MVSLDGYWAYINTATYDRQYLAFLSGNQPSTANDAFMEMVEYGPFDLRMWSSDGLEMFLKYVGALMLGKDGSKICLKGADTTVTALFLDVKVTVFGRMVSNPTKSYSLTRIMKYHTSHLSPSTSSFFENEYLFKNQYSQPLIFRSCA